MGERSGSQAPTYQHVVLPHVAAVLTFPNGNGAATLAVQITEHITYLRSPLKSPLKGPTSLTSRHLQSKNRLLFPRLPPSRVEVERISGRKPPALSM